MTVIVAAQTKTGVIMAADNLTTSGWQKLHNKSVKLWTDEGFGFGAAGCLRSIQVVRHHTTWPKYRPKEAEYLPYLVKELVPAIRRGINGHGITDTEKGVERIAVSLIVCTKTEIAEVSGNGAVVQERRDRMAVGSGYAEAIGALGDTGPWTEDDVIDAVRRASTNAVGVGGAISVLRMRDQSVREVPA